MGSGFALDMIARMRKNASEIRSKRRKFENKDLLEDRYIHDHHSIYKKHIGRLKLKAIKVHIREQALSDRKKEIRKFTASLILSGIILAALIYILHFLYHKLLV